MTTLDRYIIRRLLYGYLLAAVVLLSVFAFIELLEQIDDVSTQYTYADAFVYTLYSLPRHLVRLMPFIGLIGTLSGFVLLVSSNELVAIRAAGTSLRRLVLIALLAGGGLIVVNLVLEQFVAPAFDKSALGLRARAFNQYEELGQGLGLWARSPDQILRIGSLQHGRIPSDVELFMLGSDGRLEQYIHAARVHVERSDRWIFNDVIHKHLQPGAIHSRELEQYVWRPFTGLPKLETLVRPAENMSLTDLYAYVRYLQDTDQPPAQFSRALWEKLGRLITTMAMILIAVHVLIRAPHRQTGGVAILVVVGMLIFALLDQIVSGAGPLLNLPAVLAALAPEAVLLGCSLLLLRRSQLGHD